MSEETHLQADLTCTSVLGLDSLKLLVHCRTMQVS